jgi:sugar porter (SP) family MFS transporter
VSNSYESVLIGRFISGVGVGIVSMAAPLYLAEVSPPHYRGTFVSLYQLCVALGILVSFCANYFFAEAGQWRWMFAIGIFPAVLQMFALFFLPDTPAWLFSHDRDKQAIEALGRLRKDKHWVSQVPEMKATGHKGRAGKWKDLLSPKLRFILIIGFILGAVQQLTGVNAVIYYAPKIFGSSGFESATGAIIASICIGGINVLATGLSAWILDRVGRRILLLIGVAGMAVSLGFLSIAFFTASVLIDKISIISLMAYIAFFAIGLGPVTWVILSEIYPLKVRGKALTIAIFLNWACNYLVSLTFLHLISDIGPQGTFLMYALISAATFWFIYRFIPETRGKSLEEIEHLVTR